MNSGEFENETEVKDSYQTLGLSKIFGIFRRWLSRRPQ